MSMCKRIELTFTCYLPDDIIVTEILPRLPVKTLLRFKWASKSWLSLISTNKFAKAQLQYSAKMDTPLAHHSDAILVSTDSKHAFVINHCPVGSLLTNLYMDAGQFDFTYRATGCVPRIVGCCNGLCCILIAKHFFLWNPSTKEYRRLPSVLDKFECVSNIQGFGYDESRDDYNVLAKLITDSCLGKCVFRLYSSKTDSWKTIHDFLGGDTTFGDVGCFGGKGAFVNGKLHWMGGNPLIIVSFDLGMKVARVVERPSSVKHLYQGTSVIQGCLSVMCHNKKKGTEVWTRKEYGVKESWCKTAIVSHPGTSNYFPRNDIFCISEDVAVVNAYQNTLYIYNQKTRRARHLRLLNLNQIYEVEFCTQSLVSPFRHGELDEPN